LTGRENVYINGQLLGFTKNEIDQKLNAILQFAEIGEFIDSPVQNYSSGMKVRLGFAVAAQMDPDVLIIDEVLAVGDLGFILKCFNTMDSIMQKTAVIFVSHNMPQVSRICSSIVLMEKGTALFQGNDVSKGIDLYYSEFAEEKNVKILYRRGNDAELVELKIMGNENSAEKKANPLITLNHLDDLVVSIILKVRNSITGPNISLTIYDKEERPVGICLNPNELGSGNVFHRDEEYNFYKINLRVPRLNLSKGIYSLALTVSEKLHSQPLLRMQSVEKFQVISKNDVWPPIEFEAQWS
jgi:lipopolysaccharide transport system ATP-binding protein